MEGLASRIFFAGRVEGVHFHLPEAFYSFSRLTMHLSGILRV
jgi:hypothetical protein